MLKSSNRITFTTEAVNCFGFRVLTSGIIIDDFILNPLMLWMHKRPKGESRDEILPLGNVLELQTESTNMTGQSYYDDTDSFAISIYNKYENKTLRMASAGLVPIEWSDDPNLKLPGQTSPTLVKSKLQEISMVDIGANPEALAVVLYDASGNKINLSATTAKNVISSIASSNTASNPVNNDHNAQTLAIVGNAVKAGKFTKDEADMVLRNGADPAGVATIHQKVKEAKINPDRLTGSIPEVLKPLVSLSWYELENSFGGKKQQLKEHAPEVYKAKFFEKHGRLPAESNGKPL